jgi:hypothetical protein
LAHLAGALVDKLCWGEGASWLFSEIPFQTTKGKETQNTLTIKFP